MLFLSNYFFLFLLHYYFVNRALDKREYLVIIRDTEFLSILHINISCDPASEPSQRFNCGITIYDFNEK